VLGLRTTVMEREGQPWVTVVLQDITEVKQLEDLLRRAERLRAVAELGASLAHEIKNPLASIRSAVEQLAADQLASEDRAVLRRLVLVESERLSRLLSDFMEFSRVEMRRWSVLDVDALMVGAIELVQQHPDRSAETEIRYQPARGIQINGDQDLLHRAFFNLVLNAVQHSGPGGLVRVEVERLRAADLPGGVKVEHPFRVRVRDSGPGVRDEDVARLFDPFYSTRAGGTWLGLALVHRAVEAHHGAILLEAHEGPGACFTMYLPAHAVQEAEIGVPA
jgi:two-component system sensor histidine kinase PilS (NtrC family)